MKKILLIALCVAFGSAFAAEDKDEVQTCLKNWKTHPFKGKESDFRVIGSKVKVLGMGDEMIDGQKTNTPELVFVKPTVNVMSKSVIRLLNPNGWYCLKSNVAVMGKTEIEVDCKAKLASATTGATVLGKDETDNGNVTVLGKNTITKVNCQ
jgi:hypothetical protein